MKKNRLVCFSKSPLLEEDKNKWRALFMLCFLMFLMALLIMRAAYLQIYRQDFLQDKGEARYSRNITLPALRGKIFDRNGEILAMSLPVKSVWALPEDAVSLTKEELENLGKLLGLKPVDIINKMKGKKNFVYLKRQVEPEVTKAIAEAKFPGIHQENTFKRYYSTGSTNAHITGFTDLEEEGQEGIELALNRHLTGINGERRVLKNRRGQVIEEIGPRIDPENGKDVTLTIDNRIQYIASTALEEAVSKHKAKAGSAVVLDAKTGEILALANYPTYNPNTRENLTGEKLRNRAITDIFEPGSTIKPFIVGLALDKKMVKEETVFDTTSVNVGGKNISDAHGHDALTVAQIIQKSSNIGTVKIGMKFKPQELWDLFDTVGLGKKVGIGFPGEAKGLLRKPSTWKPIEQATMSFGHGLSVNLVQMAHAYLAFTNNGEVMPISLVKKENLDEKPVGKKAFSEATSKRLQIMLESVTSKEGTARQAQTVSYRTAGKTGTAHKLVDGRYANKYIGSFIGFAPVSDPKIIVAVMLDEPKVGGYYGGVVAAPVFSKIVESVLFKLGVQPDKMDESMMSKVGPDGKKIELSLIPKINDKGELVRANAPTYKPQPISVVGSDIKLSKSVDSKVDEKSPLETSIKKENNIDKNVDPDVINELIINKDLEAE